jgi:hypothetical protein
MNEYSIKMSTLISLGVQKDEIYFIAKHEEELLQFYNYCQEQLIQPPFQLDNSFFYLYNSFNSINGFAFKKNGYLVCSITMGLYSRFQILFNENIDLLKIERLDILNNINHKSDYPLENLMFHFAINSTFLHEYAHLIQFRSSKNSVKMSEDSNWNKYKEIFHVKEIDADIFSALFSSSQLFQYIRDYLNDPTVQEVELFISLMLSAILIRILLSPNSKLEFYSKSCSHPHWAVRMLIIGNTLISQTEQLLFREYNIAIDTRSIVLNSLALARKISNKYIPEISTQNLGKIFEDNGNEIQNYYDYLFKQVKKYRNGAYNQWMKKAKSVR